MNRAVWLTTVLMLVGAGCDSGGDPDPEKPGAEDEGGEEEPTEGGPLGDDEPAFDVNGIKTAAAESDTVELATRADERDPQAEVDAGDTEGSMEDPAWEPKLRIVFTSAQREGENVTVNGEAEYLHDEGGYALHSEDFEILVPKAEEDLEGGAVQDPSDIPDEPADPDSTFDTHTAAESEVLATVTADEPSADFAVTVAGVPPEDESELNGNGNYGRMVSFETPDELWGHTVEVPPDFVPGRACLVEGESWYDSELFAFADLPCDT